MARCCVEGCSDAQTKDITYFNFPASKALRRAWIAAISPTLKPKLNSVVCSRHFLSEDCESARGRTRLRAGAVPSVFDKTKRKRRDSTSSEDELPITIGRARTTTSDAEDPPTTDKNKQEEKVATETNEGKVEDALGINLTDKLKVKYKTGDLQNKRKNLHEKLKSLHDKNKSLLNQLEGVNSKGDGKESGDLQKKSDDLDNESNDLKDKSNGLDDKSSGLKDKSNGLQDKSNGLQDKSKDLKGKSGGLQSDSNVLQDKSESSKGDGLQRRDGEERVQERSGEETEDVRKEIENQSSGDREKCTESVGTLRRPPDVARDSDKQPEDIEDLLTHYQIKQDRALHIHTVTEAPEPPPDRPVFIEISVDKDKSGNVDKGDCLMVMESVEVELDPSELMLPDREEEMETVEIDDAPPGKEDPISLLTSSDEDDVIIEEPHIDTVEVSDETDEDDVPLVKLLKRRRAEKKKNIDITAPDGEADLAKILWGMYEYYCVQCHYTTSSGTEYRRHTASHAKVLMMCQICGYMTASESQFTKHEKQHGEKKYKCHLCTYKAKHNMSLLYHLKGHKAEDFLKTANVGVLKRAQVSGKVFECRNCAYTTKKRCDLKRHVTRRHKKNEDDEDFVP